MRSTGSSSPTAPSPVANSSGCPSRPSVGASSCRRRCPCALPASDGEHVVCLAALDLRAQLDDLVAQPRGRLEVERLGRRRSSPPPCVEISRSTSSRGSFASSLAASAAARELASPSRTYCTMSAIALRIVCGSMPCSSLYAIWIARRRFGLVDRQPHRVGDLVGVHDDLARHVARRAADRLDERAVVAQEALLVGVEDRDERDLGQVEALAQQVDADEHVEDAQRAGRAGSRRARACRCRSAGSATLRPCSNR